MTLTENKVFQPNPSREPNVKKFSEAAPIPGMTWEEMGEICQSMLLCIPYRAADKIEPGLCENFPMWGRFAIKMMYLRDPHGGFIEVVRAGMVRTFLEYAEKHPEIKYLVMIDSDETVQWDAPIRLARWGLPVVSGVVCGFSEERGPFACFTVADESGVQRFPSLKYTSKLPGNGLVKAGVVGTGLLCVRKDVFETIINDGDIPFFIPEDIRREGAKLGVMKRGEDIVFANQCEDRGIDRHVDLSVRALHHKQIALGWPEENIDYDMDAENWKPDIADHGI